MRAPLVLLTLTTLAGPACANTLLHLSDTESVSVPPDTLVATLRVQASGNTASAAQQQVNTAAAAALNRIRQVQGVRVETEGYTAWQPKQQGAWEASQSLRLTSSEGPPLLALVGQLQQSGLAISDLQWQLSPEAFRAAQQQATVIALRGLRDKADHAAETIGLRFDSFQRINIAGPEVTPMRRMMTMAAAAAPPQAVSQDIRVSATAEADVVLLPR
jgi:predicted secreted protein